MVEDGHSNLGYQGKSAWYSRWSGRIPTLGDHQIPLGNALLGGLEKELSK